MRAKGHGRPAPYRLTCLFALLLACGLLFPWGCEAGPRDSRMHLSFSFWGDYKALETWREVARRFEAAHPGVSIGLQYTPHAYGQKLQLQLLSNSAADLILMDDETYPGYAARGYLEDLGPYIERDRAELRVDAYYPTAMPAFTFRGFTGGLPWGGTAVVMFYNKDLFDAAGIPYPDDNWTWEDFREISLALTRDTDGDGRLDQFGNLLGFGFLDIEPLVWSFGGRILNEDYTAAAVDSPVFEAAMAFMQALKFEDRSSVWFGDYEGMSTQVQLLTGRIGMTAGGWFVTQILEDAEGGMRWGACPMPAGPAGRVTRATWDAISINAAIAPEKKAAAWEFAKFLLSEPTQEYLAQSGRAIPVVRDYAERYFVRPDSPADERVVLDALEYGRITPVTAKYIQLKARIESWVKKLELEDPRRRATPAEILAPLARAIDEVLASELDEFGEARQPIEGKDPTLFQAVGAGLLAVLAAVLIWLGRRSPKVRHEFHLVRHSRMRRREALWGLVFAAPWFAGFTLFLGFPFLFSIVLSFSAWDPYQPLAERTFIGLDNYVKAFTQDNLMWLSLRNTFKFAAIALPINLCGALGLAMLLNRSVRGIGLFRTLFYMPNVVGGVATVIMWVWIFNPQYGPLNGFLRGLNDLLGRTFLSFISLPEPQWLQDPNYAMHAMVLMILWTTGGGSMLVFLAGLQGIPGQLYEAAEIDGAGRWRQFWNVTIPMLTPTIFFNLILGMIGALQVFTFAFLLVGREGGPNHQLLFFVMHLYNKAFIEYNFGYGAALAWILFAVILVFTLLTVRSSALWVYYEGERSS